MKASATLLLALLALFNVALCTLRNDMLAEELKKIVGTPSETVEAVQDIFSRAHKTFHDDFKSLYVMKMSANPETFKYVLSKTVNLNRNERAGDITGIVTGKVMYSKPGLTPEDADFAIVRTCMEELSRIGVVPAFYDRFVSLCEFSSGNFELIRLFLDSGVKFPTKYLVEPNVFKKNTMSVINLLLDQGSELDLSRMGYFVMDQLSEPSFKAHQFNRLFESGLDIDFNKHNAPWIKLAMRHGRLDLARVAYKRGRRLPKSHSKNASVTDLARYIAAQEIFDKVKVLVEASFQKGHPLYGLSMSAIYAEMFAAELESETASVMSGLIRN